MPYAIVGAIAAYLYYVATQFDFYRRPGTIGPDFWPKLVLALIIAVCVVEIVRLVLTRGRSRAAAGVLQELVEESAAREGESGAGSYIHVAPKSPLMLLGGIALTGFYVWVIQRLGFALATAPYVALFIALGGYRRWGINLAVSVIGTLLMMFFFMKVVYVSLPIGREPFAQVTLVLMQLMGIR